MLIHAYEATANVLRDRIVDLIPGHPEILEMDDCYQLFNVPGFKCDDLNPSMAQASAALMSAKFVHRERRINEIRATLREFVLYDVGESLRAELRSLALKHYVPKHSNDEYMQWICKNLPSFRECGAQDRNSPWVFEMFTVVSQHVYGDCIQECLDNGMEEH